MSGEKKGKCTQNVLQFAALCSAVFQAIREWCILFWQLGFLKIALRLEVFNYLLPSTVEQMQN
jgi:hypothetical protein